MSSTAPNVPPTLPEDVAPEIGYNSPKFSNYLFVLILLAGPAYFASTRIFQANTANSTNAGIVGVSIIVSLISFIVTRTLISHVKLLTQKAGLFGKDLNKGEVGRKMQVPEALGIVPATVFIVAACTLQFIISTLFNMKQDELTQFNAGLFTTCFMVFLGFADDVLELRWRYKLILPAFACLPIVMAYSGVTTIIVPKPFAAFFGPFINLGLFYKVYMGLLSVFCANSINILAGVNGLEAGQALVIACAIVVHNCIELAANPVHLYSLIFMILFIGITLALLSHNWYPSKVFVGDTFTYFAGVSFAVVAILGHFSKTLMLFFIPQWINFFLSVPQLVGWKECPRHRLPRYDEKTKTLSYSDNYTLLNAILYMFGPKSEKTLTMIVLVFQVACCAFGFVVRYQISLFFYDK